MKSVAIEKELSTYLPLLSKQQQSLVLEMVKSILHIDNKEKRISIEQYNIEIDAALKEIKAGKGISHSDVVKQSKKWLKRK
jgi:DNA-directed RNA polymerase specialized sigma subunit